jgi:hypothetical protein
MKVAVEWPERQLGVAEVVREGQRLSLSTPLGLDNSFAV